MMLLVPANKMWARLRYWREMALQRAELANMSDEMLKDLGISRAEAEFEARRPFWDTRRQADLPCGQQPNNAAFKLH